MTTTKGQTTMQTRSDFESKAAEMSAGLADDMRESMMQAYDAMTADEREALDLANHPYLIVRAVAMAIGSRVLADRFDCSAIEKLTPKVKRIISRRGL